MEIKVNNQIKKITSNGLTVQMLLDLERPNKQNGIALAINGVVVPKSNWNSHYIKEKDEILIISATQGG
ncbi:sulfur carrier protein ThiS [Flavobacterium cucumis]|uniref:Sulfur carrier protein ThiS n=1 Tax=Flavobacterium cucumis TaxID=416016 RepID=A0A1M7ZT91_9FLAO|nr:sulfur carrier protein ThiS [Flavobacterium cucumis]SHO72129.1 sulfur carrier protein ThiS [Flavobacterium cucumis]